MHARGAQRAGSHAGYHCRQPRCRARATSGAQRYAPADPLVWESLQRNRLSAINIPDWPASVELGFRAGAPQMEIKLSINSNAALDARQRCRGRIEDLFGDHVIGEGDTLLAARVLDLLRQRGETLTTAESCTGGLIASMLTRIAGSSDGFHAGFVTLRKRH